MFVFDPYAPEIDADPFPAYKRLRDEFPCFWSEQAKMFVLSRYADVSRALNDWETYSSGRGNLMDELPGRAGSTLGSTDPPRHDRLRALVQIAFTKRSVDQLTDPTIAIASTTARELADRGGGDFIDLFASRVTVGTLFKLMGLPEEDHALIRRRVVTMVQTDAVQRQKGPANLQAFEEMVAYVREQIAFRRKQPGNDMVSRLIAAEIDGDRLAESEIVMTSMTLIMAGVESLSSFLAMMALNLADFPEARRKLVADPSQIGPAIEESLRYNTSAQRFRRVLAKDVVLHGVSMKTGQFVCLAYGAANRDERKYANPDAYDVARHPRDHLGFGGGVHICIGTMMARLVTRLAMLEFLKRIPDYAVSTDNLSWSSSTTFRAPLALPITIGRA